MQGIQDLVPLREYCRHHSWPRITQWHHWIYSKAPIAQQCVKRIGGRYLVDLEAFRLYVKQATLEESTKA